MKIKDKKNENWLNIDIIIMKKKDLCWANFIIFIAFCVSSPSFDKAYIINNLQSNLWYNTRYYFIFIIIVKLSQISNV